MKIYIEKKEKFATGPALLKKELEEALEIEIEELRLINVYISEKPLLESMVEEVLMDPFVDIRHENLEEFKNYKSFRREFLPGQFDSRSFWANEALHISYPEAGDVKHSQIFFIRGVHDEDFQRIKGYLMNPIEYVERGLEDEFPLEMSRGEDFSFTEIDNFVKKDAQKIIDDYGLSLSPEDLHIIQDYFALQKRNPNITELKMLDTYWSDHCRHTTFHTTLKDVDFSSYPFQEAKETYDYFMEHSEKELSLMNLAVFSLKLEKKRGNLKDLVESEEVNAATICREIDGKEVEILFKNETHNHPTEIEPFGGAATCLGGAIRDPLSGRAHVYQAMRITGAANPFQKERFPGKLFQRQICTQAAAGYSSYGNQIGLNTGYVKEYYHPGFEAKRMETGFVIGCVEKKNVHRQIPAKGDLLLLIGGATGIDGVGGASGSSKKHDEDTTTLSAAEVQKGNPPEERKIQRLFMMPEITKRIKRCNDLGAGGISVAFGEIADSLDIHLEHVHTKYDHIVPMELLLSESQERMALVIDKKDLALFEEMAAKENVPLCQIGEVTDTGKLRVFYKDRVLAELHRSFLEQNGAKRETGVEVSFEDKEFPTEYLNDPLLHAHRLPLQEEFDHSIGRSNVLAPFGGEKRLSPVEGMVSLIPIGDNREHTTIATCGYQPYISQWSPFHGAYYSVLESIAKAIVLGSDLKNLRFTFQEYFPATNTPKAFGKPFLALLGANRVLHAFQVPAIGGKDSMSGSFTADGVTLEVPPSLISFAVNTGKVEDIVTPELKKWGHRLVLFPVEKNKDKLVDLDKTKAVYESFIKARDQGKILSAKVVDHSVKKTLLEMAAGNGVNFYAEVKDEFLLGSIVAEMKEEDIGDIPVWNIGETIYSTSFFNMEKLPVEETVKETIDKMTPIYPISERGDERKEFSYRDVEKTVVGNKEKVKVLIPVFTGTNCEKDVKEAFEEVSPKVEVDLHIYHNPKDLAKAIDECDILSLAGGFSASDEPDGSAKFIACVFRSEEPKAAFHRLIERKGLVLGICNGFQALVKLGVFYNDTIMDAKDVHMTLTYNKHHRHVARTVNTYITSKASPFLQKAKPETLYPVPVSHGEGRLVMEESLMREFEKKGQIATRYLENPNGSLWDIEGLVSPSGQIFAKMGHSERIRENTLVNLEIKEDMNIFAAAVEALLRKDSES